MLNLLNLVEGEKLRLRNGAEAEVIENMRDGIWVQVRFTRTAPGGPNLGDEELVHCEEIAGLAGR
ncbi:MAG: hypothetical protein JWQ07_4935 [Ramlibacter sp.]|nr:hypothetical protein [Ramlibacter sp.]